MLLVASVSLSLPFFLVWRAEGARNLQSSGFVELGALDCLCGFTYKSTTNVKFTFLEIELAQKITSACKREVSQTVLYLSSAEEASSVSKGTSMFRTTFLRRSLETRKDREGKENGRWQKKHGVRRRKRTKQIEKVNLFF